MKNKIKKSEEYKEQEANLRTIGVITDKGRRRDTDEDSVLAVDFNFGMEEKTTHKYFLAVADGMGGHAMGEIASQKAISILAKEVFPKLFFPHDYDMVLKNAIKEANVGILNHIEKYPQCAGMGTTTIAAIVEDNDVYLANVGDSRAYLVSEEEIRRISKDQSYVQHLVDTGEITQEQARTHPEKNKILGAVGLSEKIKIDTMKLTLSNDEFLLLCCDGVVDHLTDEQIQKIILSSTSPQKACNQIVKACNMAGGFDNISLTMISPT